MHIRHKIPTIFNLSMVDVLCCALGCCILLWLLNLREAQERSELAGRTKSELTETELKLQSTNKELEQTSRQARIAESQRDRLTEELNTANKEKDALNKSLASLKAQYALNQEQIARLDQDQQALEKEKEGLGRKLAALGLQLREKEGLAR